jgi:hypothetical protein
MDMNDVGNDNNDEEKIENKDFQEVMVKNEWYGRK